MRTLATVAIVVGVIIAATGCGGGAVSSTSETRAERVHRDSVRLKRARICKLESLDAGLISAGAGVQGMREELEALLVGKRTLPNDEGGTMPRRIAEVEPQVVKATEEDLAEIEGELPELRACGR